MKRAGYRKGSICPVCSCGFNAELMRICTACEWVSRSRAYLPAGGIYCEWVPLARWLPWALSRAIVKDRPVLDIGREYY